MDAVTPTRDCRKHGERPMSTRRPKKADALTIDLMVRKERLELSRVAPLEPKSSASTSSATFAFDWPTTPPLHRTAVPQPRGANLPTASRYTQPTTPILGRAISNKAGASLARTSTRPQTAGNNSAASASTGIPATRGRPQIPMTSP